MTRRTTLRRGAVVVAALLTIAGLTSAASADPTVYVARLEAASAAIPAQPGDVANDASNEVQRVGAGAVQASAVATSSTGDVVDQILGVSAVRGATLIADGSLTRRTVNLLSANGNTVVIAAAQSSADSYPGPPSSPIEIPTNAASDVRASAR